MGTWDRYPLKKNVGTRDMRPFGQLGTRGMRALGEMGAWTTGSWWAMWPLGTYGHLGQLGTCEHLDLVIRDM